MSGVEFGPTNDQKPSPDAGACVVVDDVLGVAERQQLLERADGSGWRHQLGELPDRTVMVRRTRSHVVDQTMAALVFERLRPALPPLSDFLGDRRVTDDPRDTSHPNEWQPSGVNPLLRVYRYETGGEYREHHDEAWVIDGFERSFLTVLFCLGGQFSDGETEVDGVPIPPVPGRAIVFDHRRLHAGRPVTAGEKLLARSDVLFKRAAPMR